MKQRKKMPPLIRCAIAVWLMLTMISIVEELIKHFRKGKWICSRFWLVLHWEATLRIKSPRINSNDFMILTFLIGVGVGAVIGGPVAVVGTYKFCMKEIRRLLPKWSILDVSHSGLFVLMWPDDRFNIERFRVISNSSWINSHCELGWPTFLKWLYWSSLPSDCV